MSWTYEQLQAFMDFILNSTLVPLILEFCSRAARQPTTNQLPIDYRPIKAINDVSVNIHSPIIEHKNYRTPSLRTVSSVVKS